MKTEKPVQRRLTRAYICLLLSLLILAGVFVWRYAATHVYFIRPSSVSYIEVESVTSYAKLEEREEIEAAVRLINRFTYSSQEELPPLGGRRGAGHGALLWRKIGFQRGGVQPRHRPGHGPGLPPQEQ